MNDPPRVAQRVTVAAEVGGTLTLPWGYPPPACGRGMG
jgi:hypothetical protein